MVKNTILYLIVDLVSVIHYIVIVRNLKMRIKSKKVVDVSEVIEDCMIEDILNPITNKNSGIENIFAEIERAGNSLEKRLGKDRLDKLMESIKDRN